MQNTVRKIYWWEERQRSSIDDWYDNIKEWTRMRYEMAPRIAMDRDKWRATVSSNVESLGT